MEAMRKKNMNFTECNNRLSGFNTSLDQKMLKFVQRDFENLYDY